MKRIFALSLVLVLACLGAAVHGQAKLKVEPIKLKTVVRAADLGSIRTQTMMRNLNKQVTLKGVYYDGSIPMVLDNIDRAYLDLPIPDEAYVPIVGPRPVGVKWGDAIEVTGTLKKPGPDDPPEVQRESAVIKTSQAADLKIVKIAKLPMLRAIQLQRYPGLAVATLLGKKYAVLIAGGASPANNHLRYWNDLKTMYSILTSEGYAAANIYVIYANGVAKDASMPVNHSASKANIATVFNQLAAKMKSNDTLYIMVNDHGGGCLTTAVGPYGPGLYGGVIDANNDETLDAISESAINVDLNGDGDKNDTVKVDESFSLWYDSITDDEFGAEVNKISNYRKMIIQMKQCFSGGFVEDLTTANRIVMSSCSPTQLSWSHTSGNYGEFTYYYFAALTGNKPDGSGSVNADANGNGKVSILEAYNYARSHDTRPEMPLYEDNGVRPPLSGAMPAGGEGALGAATNL